MELICNKCAQAIEPCDQSLHGYRHSAGMDLQKCSSAGRFHWPRRQEDLEEEDVDSL